MEEASLQTHRRSIRGRILLTLVTCRGVRPDNGLLGVGRLELGEEGASDLHPRHLVLLGQLEDELLGVVVDDLDVLEQQGDEALVAAEEGLLRRAGHRLLHLGLGLLGARGPEVPVARAGGPSGSGAVEEGVVRTTTGGLGRLGRVCPLEGSLYVGLRTLLASIDSIPNHVSSPI